jgi:hypothetical protein
MKRRAGTKFAAVVVFLALSLSCKEEPPPLEAPVQKVEINDAPYVWAKSDSGWIISPNKNYVFPDRTPWLLFLDYTWTGNDDELPLELAVHSGDDQGTITQFDFVPKTKPDHPDGYRKTTLVFYSGQWKTFPARITVHADNTQALTITDVRIEEGPDITSPIPADPGTMMTYPRSVWRNPRYEVFTHNLYPSLLYLVSESFAVQSAFLRRLAFFVEKKGFAGRLAMDEEIAHLRDWFAHDYRAEDLAAFFDLAREQNFPLNNNELLLRDLLVKNGIIIYEEGRYTEGKGALLGFSIESRDRLPVYYVHESIHGLEFIIPELEALFLEFFDSFSDEEKIFVRDAFLYRDYNVAEDKQLLASETASYLLQQKAEDADEYFRDYLLSWYIAYHQARATGNSAGEYSDRVTEFVKNNPEIFGIRTAVLQREFRAICGLSAENFYDLLPKE